MRHGDEIQILSDGLSIRPKSLEPISISHKSQCWGVWIEPRRTNASEAKDNPVFSQRDLVISPIHPSLWPFVFRIEAALNPAEGTIHSLTKQLKENDVNILFVDQSPAGYTHSILNAICAFEGKSRERMSTFFESMEQNVCKTRSRKGPEETETLKDQLKISAIRKGKFKKLGQDMLSRLIILWSVVRKAEQDQFDNRSKQGIDVYFLAQRVVEEGLEPWFLPALDLSEDGKVEKKSLSTAQKREIGAAVSETSRILDEILKISSGSGENAGQLLKKLQEAHRVCLKKAYPGEPMTVQAKLAWLETESWQRGIIRRFAWRHAHLPMQIQALVRLAEMRFWMAPYDPIEFCYDANRCLLKPRNADLFRQQVQWLGKCGPVHKDKPIWALATYSHEDRFVRLRFLPDDGLRSRRRIQISYRVNGVPAAEPHYVGLKHRRPRTLGLIAAISGVICKPEVKGNILRMTNSNGAFDPNTGVEIGRIRFSVEFKSEGWNEDSEKSLKDSLEAAVRGLISPSDAKCSVLITPFTTDRIFVSHIAGSGRADELCRILDKVAMRFGLQTVYVSQSIAGVRNLVNKKIKSCRYFLQIITPRAEDQMRMRVNPQYVPDFTWVSYELGAAMALKSVDNRRRCVQLVDTLMPDLARAVVDKIRGDVPPIPFRIDDTNKQMRTHFTKAIEELIKQGEP